MSGDPCNFQNYCDECNQREIDKLNASGQRYVEAKKKWEARHGKPFVWRDYM